MSKLVPYTTLRRSRRDLALCRCITKWRSEPDPTMEQISLFFSFCNLSRRIIQLQITSSCRFHLILQTAEFTSDCTYYESNLIDFLLWIYYLTRRIFVVHQNKLQQQRKIGSVQQRSELIQKSQKFMTSNKSVNYKTRVIP